MKTLIKNLLVFAFIMTTVYDWNFSRLFNGNYEWVAYLIGHFAILFVIDWIIMPFYRMIRKLKG